MQEGLPKTHTYLGTRRRPIWGVNESFVTPPRLHLSWIVLGLSWIILGLPWIMLGLSWMLLGLSWIMLGLYWIVHGLL